MVNPATSNAAPLRIGRYTVSATIGAGGMATVHLASVTDSAGFVRAVAVKRLHAHYAADPRFARMFLEEARLAMRVRHPHVVSTLEAVAEGGEVFLVMDYVVGDSLAALQRAVHDRQGRMPPAVAVGIMVGALYGLHAAHEAKGESGLPLLIVHRDVSPQNVLVGVDGLARVLDFGVAKAQGQKHATEDGEIKGKLRYMAPEQLVGTKLDRRVDVFAAGIVLWELLAGRSLFDGDNPAQILRAVMDEEIAPPSRVGVDVPAALDRPLLRALSRRPEERFDTAREMAMALESALVPASAREIGEWVSEIAGARIQARAAEVLALETAASWQSGDSPTSAPTLGASELLSDAHELQPGTTTVRDVFAAPFARRWRVVALSGILVTFAALASTMGPRLRASSASSASSAGSAADDAGAALATVEVDGPSAASPASSSASSDASMETSHPVATPGSPAVRPRPARRKPDCRNLFTVDNRGFRVPRPECF